MKFFPVMFSLLFLSTPSASERTLQVNTAANSDCPSLESIRPDAGPAQDVLSRLNERLRLAETLQVQLIVNPGADSSSFTVSLSKPDRYMVRAAGQGFVRDGATERLWFTATKTYYQQPLDNPPVPPFLCVGLEAFFDNGNTFRADGMEDAILDGVACRKIHLSKQGVSGMHWSLYIRDDGVPLGWDQKPDNTKMALIQARYKDFRLDVPVPPETYDWSAEGYRLEKPSAQLPTLAVGDIAPPATLKSIEGNPVNLQTLFQGKKAILINFWFVGCAPCRDEFPFLQELHTRFAAKGLAVIGIDRGDNAVHVRDYMQEQHATFPVLLDPSGHEAAERYKVNAFPTTYILTPDGRVRRVIVGEDKAKLAAALTSLGFQ